MSNNNKNADKGDGVFKVLPSGNGNDNSSFVTRLALIASMSGLLFGYDTGVVSGAIIFIQSQMGLMEEPFLVEIIVSSTILSAAIAAAYGHILMDRKGRKATLVLASIIFVVGSVVMAMAGLVNGVESTGGYVTLVVGRIVVGAAIGLASDAGPLYISECAPPKLRGSFTTLFNVAVVGGQVVACIVCALLSYLPPTYNWRIMLGLGALPALLQMIGFVTLPPSPTWLLLQGRKDEAERVLRQIRPLVVSQAVAAKSVNRDQDGQETENSSVSDSQTEVASNEHDDHDEDPVLHELNEIQDELDTAKAGSHVGLWKLWRSYPTVRRAMILGCSLWAVSQLAGINTIMYYGASIVKKTGIADGNKSFDIWITVPLFVMQLFGIFVCYAIIDRMGRRPTLFVSMTLVWISLLFIGLGFAIDAPLLTVAAMWFYLFAFGVGLSTMPYTMNAEIYPSEYRGVCVAQATGIFWASNFVVSVTFLSLARALSNAGVFFLYAGIVIVSEVWFYFLVPETKGLSLHEIQGLFQCEDERSLASIDEHKETYGTVEFGSVRSAEDPADAESSNRIV
ncbi:sugar transporter [Nitzschia inconspicua]|uniref:Sugar transporter n=1 Tax=Nitzschia inconspicua TaxID=303405 RepID=A0A9K3KV31_9STRA|nr:sugar transporter [Nitzschia inconspicua]